VDKEKAGAPWGPGLLIALLLGVGTLFIADVPYVSDRLQDGGLRTEQRFAEQDVDARLWQDPLGVIQRARDAAKKGDGSSAEEAGGEAAPQRLEDLRAMLDTDRERAMVLAVMVRGGPYAEFVEQRRRARYAVMAGLSEMGYAPADSDHLGWLARPQGSALERELPAAIPYEWLDVLPATLYQRWALAPPKLARVLVLWLDDRAFAREPVARMAALADALTPARAGTEPIQWRIIGPVRSDTLLAMTRERLADGASPPPSYARLHYYAATPTVSDDLLLGIDQGKPVDGADTAMPDKASCRLSRHLRDHLGIQFTRTILDDSKVAQALIAELELRGLRTIDADLRGTSAAVDAPGPTPASAPAYGARGASGPGTLGPAPARFGVCRRDAAATPAIPGIAASATAPSRIAVVSEWDSLYGRASVGQSYRSQNNVQAFCVDAFYYMRGLDGLVPSPGAKDGGDDGKSSGGDAKPDNRRKDGSFIERAEGQSQFDYLRRLAKRMRDRDAALRLTNPDGRGLQAIGVLGNDVHDKLLVLQALQPEFPTAIFFTTDLDARYLHPREQEWARNLIVGSSFGLQLDDRLQSSTPPFRDSYQTSEFFATRLLVDDARRALAGERPEIASSCPREPSANWRQEDYKGWLGKPRIFEIGRTRAFDFTGRDAGEPPRLLKRVAEAPPPPGGQPIRCRWDRALDCRDVHPPGSERASVPDVWGRWLISALLLLLWLPVLRTFDGGWERLARYLRLKGLHTAERRRRIAAIVAALVLQLVVAPLACAWAWPELARAMTENGKPLVFTEGLSPWPTEFIRLFAFLLGGYLLLRGWRGLTRNQQAIADNFFLEAPRAEIAASQARVEPRLSRATRLANMFRLHEVEPAGLETRRATGLEPGVEVMWQRHIVQNRLGARLVRTAACVAVTLLLSAIVVLAFHEPRYVPQRGLFALRVHETLHVLVFAMLYFVVFFVADATALCVSFLRHLRGRTCAWPEDAVKRFERELAFQDRKIVTHWIDLQFVAARTLEVNRLVYYPFIMLSLVLLSRSPAFDDWQMPLSGKVLSGLGALVAVACAWALRRAAEATRRQALDEIDRALLRANGEPGCGEEDRAGPCAPTARQLELLREQAARLQRGAFAPYSQQPVLKALLLPFATVGGSTLLEYLSLANL